MSPPRFILSCLTVLACFAVFVFGLVSCSDHERMVREACIAAKGSVVEGRVAGSYLCIVGRTQP